MGTPIGPNVRKLIARKLSLLAIPVGSGENSFIMGVEALTNRGKFVSLAAEASDWVRDAIQAVKSAPDNAYGDDDEAIAGIILRRIEEQESDVVQ